MPTTYRKQGDKAEKKVADYLKKHGYTICENNYTRRFGEIDIIAQKDALIAFVEVKSRTTVYGNLSDIITPSKKRKIIKTAHYYIAERLRSHIGDYIYRFDVAFVIDDHIEYIRNAFTQQQETWL